MSFNRITLILFISLSITQFGLAQSSISLTGAIKDERDSVLLLNAIDSTLIKGDFFIDGNFKFENIETKNTLIKITSLGYLDTILKVNNSSSKEINLGNIKLLKNNTLNEVVISASIPLFERKEGNTIVNVENTMLSSSTSVLELLTKTPSVRVEDNIVSVFGKGEALIYLNGKQITFERLGSIPVNRILKIEVISNPSAKYDAKGRAVINIITKINTQEGLNGQINENVTQAKHFLSSHAINLNYRRNKLSLFADYSLSLGTDWNKGNRDKTISSTNETFKSHNDNEENTKLTNVSNYRFGLNYDINKHSDFSVQYDGLYNRYDLNVSSITQMSGSNGNATTLDAFNKGLTINQNNSINANYNNNLDSLGSSLFLGGQYCDFNTKLYDLIDEKVDLNGIFNNRALRINDGHNLIKLITGQVDYIKKLKKSAQLEIGAKYSNVSNNGRIDFKSKQEGSDIWESYPQFSNNFLYTENVSALYAQYSKTLKEKWQTSIGIRSEFSNVYGFSRALNKKVIDTSYVNFFPTGKITYNKSENLAFTLSFSSRINRPVYQNIDPFVWYNDSLTSSQGNPHLVPEKNYSTEFQTTYKVYSLKFGYTYTTDPIKGLPITGKNGPNSIIYSKFNLKSQQQYFCSLDIPIEKKYFNSYNTISGTYEQISTFSSNISTQTPSPQLYIYSYNQLKVMKYFKIDLSGEFSSAHSDGLYKYKPNYSFALGVSKSFFNKKLFCRLMANDFLHTYYEAKESNIGIFQSKSYSKLNTFFIRLNVVFRFGKLKEPTYKNKAVNDDEFNRIQH